MSTVLMIFLYQCNQLWSAFFSSISAGCVTGVIFLVHQNLKGREAKKLSIQVNNHPQMCSRLMEIDGQFRVHQRSLLDAEGDEFLSHLAGVVKFANQYVREFSRLASEYPKYYRDFVYESLGFREVFSEVLDKVDWLESKLSEPAPDPISKGDNSKRNEYLRMAHNVHCAFFEVYMKMLKTDEDIIKKRANIDESII